MSTNRFENLLVAALVVALVGSAVAVGGALAGEPAEEEPGEEDPETQAKTYLRAVHASPDAPAVDVTVDNETVLEDVAFGDVSDYLTLEAGTYNVTIAAADDPDTVVFDEEVTLDPRTATTLAAAGEIGENASTPFEPLLYDDNALTPDANESALSVVHLSPDAPAVDVTAENGSVVLAENVSYGDASDYATVPAGNYTVEIRAANEENDGPVVTTVNVSLEGGTAYSALAVGYLEAGNETDAAGNETDDADEPAADAAFEIVPTEDATWMIELPGEEPPVDLNETPPVDANETPSVDGANETAPDEGDEPPSEPGADEAGSDAEADEQGAEPAEE